MIIHFVRHGHPDYTTDTLTELGKKQAEAAASRLRDVGIERIYSSTKGRAMQTAEATAALLGLTVIPCDFMREISWKPLGDEAVIANGHPWRTSEQLAANGISLMNPDWKSTEPYCQCSTVGAIETVESGIDALLAELGYEREGQYYRVVGEDTNKTIAIFSHGGSSSAALAHLLNIPFPMVCGSFALDFTSISTLALSNERGALIFPKIRLLNDARHIEGITVENVYDN